MGDTTSKESSSGVVSSSQENNSNGVVDFTRSLAEFDRLCANDDPVDILRDLANTHRDQDCLGFRIGFDGADGADGVETETEADEEPTLTGDDEDPTLSDKYRHLARQNRPLARRVALCQTEYGRPAWRITLNPEDNSTHLLEYLCYRARSVPPELISIILDVAPESARFVGRRGEAAVVAALEYGQAPLGVIRNLVTVGDRGYPRSASTISATTFDTACRSSWFRGGVAEFFGVAEFSERIDILYFLLETIGPTKEFLCTKSGAGYLPLHSVIELIRVGDMTDEQELSETVTATVKELLLQVVSRTYLAWKGAPAPSVLLALVWSAQYITRYIWGPPPLEMAPNDDLIAELLAALIERDPTQLQTADESGNLPLHAAAGLHSRLVNRRREVRRHSWEGLIQIVTEAAPEAAYQRNASGRLPIHIALANGMTWSLGVRELFEAEQRVLRIADPCTRLLPFMSAAAAPFLNNRQLGLGVSDAVDHHDLYAFAVEKVETAYHLLREDPATILLVWKRM